MQLKHNKQPAENDNSADLLLAAAASSGDEPARFKLALRLTDSTRSAAYFLAKNDPNVEDYAQLAIMEIVQAAGSYRGQAPLEWWARKIAVRTIMRHIKKNRRQAKTVVLAPNEVEQAFITNTAEDDLIHRRVSKQLSKLLNELSPKLRTTVYLKLVKGYTIQEVSEITNTKVATVEDRMVNGYRRLRKKVRKDPLLKEWLGGEVIK